MGRQPGGQVGRALEVQQGIGEGFQLLEKAELLLAEFGAITLLADRAFPCDELLAWFRGRSRWRYVMRLRGDTEIHGTAAPLGCQVRRLRLRQGECRGFRGVRLWSDGSQTANLVLAHPTGQQVEEPWYLVSNAEPNLDVVWSYGLRFCCEQLFRDQTSGVFQLSSSGLSFPQQIDRLLRVVAIAVRLRRQVDPHWRRGMSFLRIGLAANPRAGAGALHPQPGCAQTAETAMVHARRATTTAADHRTDGGRMIVSGEMCPSVRGRDLAAQGEAPGQQEGWWICGHNT